VAVGNQNTAAAVSADNQNSAAANQRIALQAQQRAQARAKELAAFNQRVGRVANGLQKFGVDSYNSSYADAARNTYLDMAKAKSAWNTKYGRAYAAHIKAGENDKATVLENEFKGEYNYNPFTLDGEMAGSEYQKLLIKENKV
jgi:hypothetical protein